jgi:hypothetical protein
MTLKRARNRVPESEKADMTKIIPAFVPTNFAEQPNFYLHKLDDKSCSKKMRFLY